MSVLDNALQVLFKMAHWEILWQNASPTSAFPNQKVSIGLSKYNMVLVVCALDSNGRMIPPVIAPVGNHGILIGTSGSVRWFTTDTTGVNFDDCSNTAYNIPRFIYGITA